MKKLIPFLLSMLLLSSCSIFLSACSSTVSSGGNSGNNSQESKTEIWETSFYVDEFNNPTNKAYIHNKDVFTGTFSNSATTNSELTAQILIDEESPFIKLWEYGSVKVMTYSTENYNITILDDSGNKHYTTGTMSQYDDCIRFEDWTFVSLLQQNQTLKIYIAEDSEYSYISTYLFEVKNGNFNTVYSNFHNQYIKVKE